MNGPQILGQLTAQATTLTNPEIQALQLEYWKQTESAPSSYKILEALLPRFQEQMEQNRGILTLKRTDPSLPWLSHSYTIVEGTVHQHLHRARVGWITDDRQVITTVSDEKPLVGAGTIKKVYRLTNPDGTPPMIRAACKQSSKDAAADLRRVFVEKTAGKLKYTGYLTTETSARLEGAQVSVITAPYARNGDFLAADANPEISGKQMLQGLIEVAEELKILHGLGGAHRDIAPKNMVMDPELGSGVIDGDFACFDESTTLKAGSTYFHDRETLKSQEVFTRQDLQQMDIFSWGITLWCFATGCGPKLFWTPTGKSDKAMGSFVLGNKKFGATVAFELYFLAKRLTSAPLGERPGWDEIIPDLEAIKIS